MPEPLPSSFYARETLLVARELLGKVLISRRGGTVTGGTIVETEGYLGADDPASHAFRGPTPRAAIMFGPQGKAYVYFIYGNHFCFNVVAHDGTVGAILVRGLEPLWGIPEMARRRGTDDMGNLTNGPGKLTRALGITRSENGADLTSGDLVIADGPPARRAIVRSRRVGVKEEKPRLFRFAIKDNRFVSRPCPW